jgi:hypothetical protein
VHVVSAALSAVGSLTFVLGVVVLAVALAVLLIVVRPVVKKTRAEDVPATLVGLSHVIAALSAFLPWNKQRLPAQTAEAPAALSPDGQPGGGTPVSSTIITADRWTVMRPPGLAEGCGIEQLSVAREGGE